MPAKKYIVDLTSEERQILEQLTSKGKAQVYKINGSVPDLLLFA